MNSQFLYFFFDLIFPMAAGYLLRGQRRIGPAAFRGMMLFQVYVLTTAAMVLSFWVMKLDRALLWLPVMGVAMQVVPGAVGFWRAGRKYDSPLDRGSYILSVMLSNRGVVGMLASFIMFGESGYALTQLVMLLSSVVLFMFCFPMAQYFHDNHAGIAGEERSFLRSIVNAKQAPMLGIAAGVALNWAGVPRPPVLTAVFPYIVHVGMWLFIVPIGYELSFAEVGRYAWKTLDLFLIKFVLTPLLVIPLAWLVGLRGEAFAVVAFLTCSPVAVNAVITAKLHRLNVHLAMSALIVTTVFYLLVIFPSLYVLFRMTGVIAK